MLVLWCSCIQTVGSGSSSLSRTVGAVPYGKSGMHTAVNLPVMQHSDGLQCCLNPRGLKRLFGPGVLLLLCVSAQH
jgi:hypothetical protein